MVVGRNITAGGPNRRVSGEHPLDRPAPHDRGGRDELRSSSHTQPGSQGDIKMKWTTLMAAIAIIASVNCADAGLFGGHKKSYCCDAGPSCCAPTAACCPDPCGCAAPCGDACGCAAPCAAPCGPAACAAPCGPACGCAAPCGDVCGCAAPAACCAPAPVCCPETCAPSCGCGSYGRKHGLFGGGGKGWFKRGRCGKKNYGGCCDAPSCCAPTGCGY